MQIKFYKVPAVGASQILGQVLKDCQRNSEVFILARVRTGDDRLNQGIAGIAQTNSTEMATAIAPIAGPIRDEWKKRLDAMAIG